jgi:type I restriction-modification system DNA methylase subunit
MNNFSDKVSFIWSVADLLRGPYKPNQYGKVILPLTVLRRLDCVLEPTRQKVRDKADELKRKGTPISNLEPVLNRAAMPSDWPSQEPNPLHQELLIEGPRDHRVFRLRRTDREAGQSQPALPGRVEVRRHRSPPRSCQQRRDGLHL